MAKTMDPVESSKRLEMHVKRVSRVQVSEEPTPDGARANMASPDANYVGSLVGEEDGLSTGMRRRVLEAPLGSKIGYHELNDEKEDADEEWMTGEASQLSGAGTRGSSNWVLKIMLPILLIVGIIMLHNWWTDIKKHASNAAGAVGDVFDRRALTVTKHAQEEQDRAQKFDRAGPGLGQPKAGVAGDSAGAPGGNGADEGARQQQEDAGLPDKAVYSVNLGDGVGNAGNMNAQA